MATVSITDDMSIPIPSGRSVGEIIDYVIQSALSGAHDHQIEQALVATFGISPKHVWLVTDRVNGGIVRAAAGMDRPDSSKDPFACGSYDRAIQDHSISATIYPQFVRPRTKHPWWQFWKQA